LRREREAPVAHFDTRAVHAGERLPLRDHSPTATPIYSSTTFSHPGIATTDRVLGGEEPGYSYTRYGNPTVTAFEQAIAALEGSGRAVAFGSGMAAVHAALLAAGVGSGSRVLAAEQIFGSTSSLLVKVFDALGVKTRFVDAYDLEAIEEQLKGFSPTALFLESVSNPLLRVADVPRIAELARDAGTAVLVDNTFLTPYLQRPLDLGADIVIYSATKFLSGHGDVTSGAAVADAPYGDALYELAKLVGGILGPFEAWLSLRGLKTLSLRMQRQCENAAEIARHLAEHPKVSRVHYPGLPDHPDREVAERVMDRPGAVLAFELAEDSREAAFRFLDALELCVRAPTLGDVYTLAIHPATTSHRDLSPGRRERLGIREGLIRLSAGIENPDDLLEDLERALREV
jgi:cystathionine beta-lyase/cystathionine gamma-synthase